MKTEKALIIIQSLLHEWDNKTNSIKLDTIETMSTRLNDSG